MLIWDRDAEDMLFKILIDNEKLRNPLYCIHLHSTRLDPDKIKLVPQFLSKWIKLDNGHLIIIGDRDAFLISDNLSMKLFQLLQNNIHDFLELSGHDHISLEFYDWQINATAMMGLAKSMLATREAQRREAEKQRQAAILNANLRQDLVATLQQRRLLHKTPCVQVIEDDAFTRRLIGIAIGPHGVVHCSESGSRGISDYLTIAPSIVFLDIGLPDIDGKDVLKKIISLDPQAYVVMLSGNGNTENILKAMQLGAKGFVGKPFTPEKLVQYIAKVLPAVVKKEA